MPTVNSRLVLVAGFGGLLILMAFAGADGIQALQQIQTRNDLIRDDFMLRTQVLERIRGDLYLSGTDVRDYLLEPQAGRAEAIGIRSWKPARIWTPRCSSIRLLSSGEAEPFRCSPGIGCLLAGAGTHLRWTAEQRQKAGYAFLRDEVSPPNFHAGDRRSDPPVQRSPTDFRKGRGPVELQQFRAAC